MALFVKSIFWIMNKFRQLLFFIDDYKICTGGIWWKGFYVWMSCGVIGILIYRIERCIFGLIGQGYKYLRVFLYPFLSLLQTLCHLDISYKADIGPGLSIAHFSLGVVIAENVVIGRNCKLIGGNVIGRKRYFSYGEFIIGDNDEIGANAVIIGPLKIGSNVKIGAQACVVKDAKSDITLVGVPAQEICL